MDRLSSTHCAAFRSHVKARSALPYCALREQIGSVGSEDSAAAAFRASHRNRALHQCLRGLEA
ncbi:MAG: hypothetical protein JNM40_25130 [Myxococcales bacterium]|nr:hypothetical protein [Myxococcales bacterium]